jgi:protein TilB
MVLITEELLRKKAEHHAGGLTTLKEIALHQQGIEKIQVLNQLCRHLTCLYLHNNIIQKIENLNRLKVSL